MLNKLKAWFKNDDSYRIIILTDSQLEDSINDERQSEELKNVGFEITGGKFKGTIARLRSVMQRPVPDQVDNTRLYLIFDYVVIQINKRAVYTLEQINDESTDIGIKFTDIARPMFENFMQQVVKHYSENPNDNKN